jgi:uncharacterized membrane protein YgdD (TMEM256/DUF423 family)
MRPNFLLLAALCALTGVALGAFGAHGLKPLLTPALLETYKTAVTYQLWHSIGLGLIAQFFQQNQQDKLLLWAGWLMFAGILLFSGSLYLVAVLNIKWLGIITPVGGVAFLGAWFCVALFAYQQKPQA